MSTLFLRLSSPLLLRLLTSLYSMCSVFKTSSLIGVCSSHLRSGNPSASCWGAGRLNRDLGTFFQCTSHHPASWSSYLSWVKYTHNSLSTSATSMSPFRVVLGYQHPLFSEQEMDRVVPSVRENMRRCWWVWRAVMVALLWTTAKVEVRAYKHRAPAPSHQPRQKVWLSSKDISLWSAVRLPRIGLAPLISTGSLTLLLSVYTSTSLSGFIPLFHCVTRETSCLQSSVSSS